MKLMLTSSGFETAEIVDAFVRLCNKPKTEISVAVINEAYAVEDGDKRWVLNDLGGIVNNFGGEFDLVNLLALSLDQAAARIAKCDAIFVVGGHTDYLMSIFNKTGFSKLLPELLKDKVYVGSSAGSMIMGRRVSTFAYRKVYGERDDYGVTKYMQFADIAIKPHLNSSNFPNNRTDVLKDIASGTGLVLYGIQDDTAICIDGDRLYVVGSEPCIVDGTAFISKGAAYA